MEWNWNWTYKGNENSPNKRETLVVRNYLNRTSPQECESGFLIDSGSESITNLSQPVSLWEALFARMIHCISQSHD